MESSSPQIENEDAIEISEANTIFKEWFYEDESEQCQEFIKQFDVLLENGKVLNNGKDLTKEDSEVVKFLQSDEVLATK